MDFARKQLKKYGWKEGQGLGKNESGISKPIKVGIKRDNCGVGASPGEEFTSDWWSQLFNNAASNLSVVDGMDSVEVTTNSEQCDSGLSLKQRHYGRHRSSLRYGGFVDSTHNGDSKEEGIDCETLAKRLTDDDLMKACEGRTAHKAARHGLKLSGKLKRLQDQEKAARKRTSHKHKTMDSRTDRTTD